MKSLKSALLNVLTFFGCTAWGQETMPNFAPSGFELVVVAHEPEAGVVSIPRRGGSDLFHVKSPAVLSSADLRRVKAVTKSSWYVLSGIHSISTLVLCLKPETVARFQESISRTIAVGDRLAIVVKGEVVGVFVPSQLIMGDELRIDAGFFSQGTEQEKKSKTRNLAKQIQSTLP